MAVARRLVWIFGIYVFVAMPAFYLVLQKKIYRAKEGPLQKRLMEDTLKLMVLEEETERKRTEILELCRRASLKNTFLDGACENDIILTPMILKRFPHLLDKNLRPAVIHPSKRTGVWMVMGLSTVLRKKLYLIKTVDSLITNIHPSDEDNCLIVVLISGNDSSNNFTEYIYDHLKTKFRKHLNSGLLEVVAIPEGYYPSFHNMSPTFNDPYERAIWRTKQNLDYIFLMMYCIDRGSYYLQLEDDIVAVPEYSRKIREHKMFLKKNWFILEFSNLGFIGQTLVDC